MIQYLRQQFVYDHWANREVVSALEGANHPSPRPLQWLAHVLSAERLWLQRLQGQAQTYPVWPDFTLAQCKLETEELGRLWQSYLSTLSEDDLAITIAYQNSKGESWTNRTSDVLQHVILHSVHHRGQIVADLRASGYDPPYLDFIHAIRQGLVE
jgi:uncharacterized damage-inducible protein DinB